MKKLAAAGAAITSLPEIAQARDERVRALRDDVLQTADDAGATNKNNGGNSGVSGSSGHSSTTPQIAAEWRDELMMRCLHAHGHRCIIRPPAPSSGTATAACLSSSVASFLADDLTEIYLCGACSRQEILRRNG